MENHTDEQDVLVPLSKKQIELLLHEVNNRAFSVELERFQSNRRVNPWESIRQKLWQSISRAELETVDVAMGRSKAC